MTSVTVVTVMTAEIYMGEKRKELSFINNKSTAELQRCLKTIITYLFFKSDPAINQKLSAGYLSFGRSL